eukprot:403356122
MVSRKSQVASQAQLDSLKAEIYQVDPNYDFNYDAQFKVIVIGDSGVGKSCIVQRLTQDVFKTDHQITIGVEFGAFVMKIDGKIIKLMIWDTAGQEQFRSITKLFYKNSDAAVIVYDVTKRVSFEDVEEWQEEIINNTDEDVLQYLVGNRVDLQEEREVPTNEGIQASKEKNFAQFFETSARTGQNISVLFQTLSKQLYLKNKDRLDKFREKDDTDQSMNYRSQSIALSQINKQHTITGKKKKKFLYDYQKDGNTELSSYRIGFGSCFDKKQKRTDIFKDINQENLDLWIWLGDFAYVDKHVGVIMQYVYGQNYLIEDEETRRKKFATTYEDEYYSLLKKQTPVIGIWDDHDYGKNDGDATNPIKLNNKQVYLDFLDEPQDSPRRHRGDNTGIYEDYQIKLRKDFSVRIILLDVRFSKTKETLLGDDQWKWFENVLKNSNDQVYLLGSGVQFMMRDRLIGAERWPDKEYQRLLDLIKQYKKSGVFLLSGDVHHSQLLSPKCKLNGLGYELTEITSSGLTHTCDRNLAGLCSYALKGNTPGTYPISQVVKHQRQRQLNILVEKFQPDKFLVLREFYFKIL